MINPHASFPATRRLVDSRSADKRKISFRGKKPVAGTAIPRLIAGEPAMMMDLIHNMDKAQEDPDKANILSTGRFRVQ